MNILINSDFHGMTEKPSRKYFCPGWNISFSGSPSENSFSGQYVGSGPSKRLVLSVVEVKKWFRVYQQFKVEKGVETLGLSITAALADSVSADRPARIRVMRVGSPYSFITAAVVDNNYNIPSTPQTVDYSVNVSHLDKNEQYAIVLEFENPVSVALWCVSLTQYDSRHHTLVPKYAPGKAEESSDRNKVPASQNMTIESYSKGGVASHEFRNSLHNHLPPINQSRYDCRIERIKNHEIVGWFSSNSDPSKVFTAELYIDGLLYGELRNDVPRPDLLRNSKTMGLGGFRIKVHKRMLKKSKHVFSLKFPDGSQSKAQTIDVGGLAENQSVFDTTMSDRNAVGLRNITVLVPVYNAYEDLVECVEKLKLHTPESTNILLINDASTDSRIATFLKTLNGVDNFQVLTNKNNLGFTRTVNRGIEHASGHDVIFLNSDARVTPGWVDSLNAVANRHPNVATVTPLSDNAGAFSAPNIGQYNPLVGGVSEDIFADLVKKNSLGIHPELPTGNGFCLYVRRACIDEVGLLDEKSFPRGYGEENDFCMRAIRKGWCHLLDDTTYVFHERSASFGDEKTELIKKSKIIIHERYPEYSHLIQQFKTPAMKLVRYRVRIAQQEAVTTGPHLPKALYVFSGLTGGTPQTNRDLMSALQGVLDTWTLRCDSQYMYLERFNGTKNETIAIHELEEQITPLTHVSNEYDKVVQSWLRKYNFSLVHIRHLLWHSINLPKIAKQFGCDVVLSFHDFYTVCPTVKLLDGASNYCGGDCKAGAGKCSVDAWQGITFPNLRNSWVNQWRGMFEKAFEYVDQFVTTSHSAAGTIAQTYPEISSKLAVIPHGRDLTRGTSSFIQPQKNAPIKILVPGNISIAKGLEVIKDLVEMDLENQLEFHIMGKVSSEIALPDSVIIHGTYTRDDFLNKVNKIAPTVGAVFSIWDETYCHTLTELWAVGLPAIVFNYGTLAERVNKSGAGWVFEHSDTKVLYENIVDTVRDFDDYNEKRLAAAKWQGSEGLVNSSSLMAMKYLDIYQKISVEGTSRECEVVSTGNSKNEFMSHSTEELIAVVEGTSVSIDSRMSSLAISNYINYYGRKYRYIKCSIPELLAGVETREIENAVILDDDLSSLTQRTLSAHVVAGRLKLIDVNSNANVEKHSKDKLLPVNRVPQKATSGSQQLLPVSIWGGVESNRFNYRNRDIVVLYIHEDPLSKNESNCSGESELSRVLDVFEKATIEIPNLKLKVVTKNGAMDIADYSWLEIHTPLSSITYPHYVKWMSNVTQCVDFAINPSLDILDEFEAEIRFLEICGMGLAGLYGRTHLYRDLVKESGVGVLVADEAGWLAAIVDAAEKYQLKRIEGYRARTWIEQKRLAMASTLALYDKAVHEIITSNEESKIAA